MSSINYAAKLFAFAILFAAISTFVSLQVYAAKNKNKNTQSKQTELWQRVDKSDARFIAEHSAAADGKAGGKYEVFSANQALLKDVLAQAPLEFSEAARTFKTILDVPMPDGTIAHFRIEESPMLAPQVAAQYPTWKQYSGQGIEDPTATARFDVNDNGFHGYVIGANGTFLIDPYSLKDKKNYIVYYKGDIGDSNRGNFSCEVKGKEKSQLDILLLPPPLPAFSNGTTLRNYKIAISATKEYTNFFGGDQATAFAAIQTTVNRLILIYRRELAVTFTLVSNTNTVFTNTNDGGFPAASDPNVADTSTTRNQAVLDTAYGNANYDIGHVLSKTPNPNGLAASPSLCDPTAKAQGFTGAQTPQGDGFDVDYVAHEIGHQFSMSHTFNNDSDGSCSTRSADSAFEPASGVTIMGYGGICAPRNLSANSIEYFNLRSFDQALGYLQTTVPTNYPGCGTNTTTGNTPPTVTVAAASYNIPKQTPFTLTASATDPNSDALTYSWEEFDLGAATRSSGAVDTDEPAPNNDGQARPIFRAYNPKTSGSRTFPSLYYILNNANTPPLTYTGTLPIAPTSGSTFGYVCAAGETCVTGERLPSISRTMNFRVTVRDNNANGGGVQDASTSVIVNAGAGPFQVTTQNGSSSISAPEAVWQSGTTQTVTWDVANTNVAPINTANVNILLSTDGGQTFPITLVANTPNDGTEQITVPNNPTSAARIKVEAVGNIFFDMNNADFAITAPTAATVTVGGQVLTQTRRGVSGIQVSLTDSEGNIRTATTNSFGYYQFTDVQVGKTYILSAKGKHYTFSQPTQVLNVNEDTHVVDFTANSEKRERAF